jgi:hypothetical protein
MKLLIVPQECCQYTVSIQLVLQKVPGILNAIILNQRLFKAIPLKSAFTNFQNKVQDCGYEAVALNL